MKKLLAIALILMMSISLAVTAYAAADSAELDASSAVAEEISELSGDDAPDVDQSTTPDAEDDISADSASNTVDGSVLSSDEAEIQNDIDPEDSAADSEEESEPANEKFRIFGFTISNIITTLLVVGVFITGVVTKKMGKW